MTEYNCCHGTPESGHSPTCPYDKEFWGPDGVCIRKWGTGELVRGLQYKNNGPVQDGAKNQRRTFSGGRKHRGMASDSVK
jgi:hypothetical protein